MNINTVRYAMLKSAADTPIQQPAQPQQPKVPMFQGKPVEIYKDEPFTYQEGKWMTLQPGQYAQKVAAANNVDYTRMMKDPKNAGINWSKMIAGKTRFWMPVPNRQYVMETYGYDPATPYSEERIKDAAMRIAKAESGWGDNLRATGSTGSGWHHMLDALFNEQMKKHKDMYVDAQGKPWTKASLDNQGNSFKMAEQAIRDFVNRYQYAGKGLVTDDMKPIFRYWRSGWDGMNSQVANDYADELWRIY